MSLENGILGFLSIKPQSGYDIKKLFDISASFFWPANQAQIYRTLKALTKDGQIELRECTKGITVDKKVFAITEKGRDAYLKTAAENTVEDFISRDVFLMQLFFSGGLPEHEQLEFIETQLENVKLLKQRLIENYEKNLSKFTKTTGLDNNDRRLHSAVCAHRWGLIKCREYGIFLEDILNELKQNHPK